MSEEPSVNGSSALLGKNTRFASTLAKKHENRARRFYLQAIARKFLPCLSLEKCYRWYRSIPEIVYNEETCHAHYENIMVCGSIWICPVCAAAVTERRKEEIASGMRGFDGTVFLSTFTLQHRLENKLSELIKDLNDVYRELKSGRWWIEFELRWGLVGSVRSFEVTVSLDNGWHPHLHTLFFSYKRVNELDQNQIQVELEERFIKLMEKRGRFVKNNLGVKVEKGLGSKEEGDEALKLYVGKWGLSSEVAKGVSKTGKADGEAIHYSPFQLLDLANEGDKQAEKWFLEYAAATKGIKQLVWSRGLRQYLGLSKKEKTDQELAEEKADEGKKDRMPVKNYPYVSRANAAGILLNIREKYNRQAVIDFVSKLKETYIDHYADIGLEIAGVNLSKNNSSMASKEISNNIASD